MHLRSSSGVALKPGVEVQLRGSLGAALKLEGCSKLDVKLRGCSGAALKPEIGAQLRGSSGAALEPEADSIFEENLRGCSGALVEPEVEVQLRGSSGAALKLEGCSNLDVKLRGCSGAALKPKIGAQLRGSSGAAQKPEAKIEVLRYADGSGSDEDSVVKVVLAKGVALRDADESGSDDDVALKVAQVRSRLARRCTIRRQVRFWGGSPCRLRQMSAFVAEFKNKPCRTWRTPTSWKLGRWCMRTTPAVYIQDLEIPRKYTPYCLRRGGAPSLFRHTGRYDKVAEKGR